MARPAALALAALLLAVPALAAPAPAAKPAAAGDAALIDAFNKNSDFKAFAALAKSAGWTPEAIPAGTTATVFVPTNAAVAGFLKDMGLTPADVEARPVLVDLMLAYHVVPGKALKALADVPGDKVYARTGDVNYVLRLYRDPKAKRTWVQDVQGNNVTLTQEPTVVGNVALVPVSKVLYSGAYFTSPSAALKHYPQFKGAAELVAKSGLDASALDGEVTLLLPTNEAVAAASKTVAGLKPAEVATVLKAHVLPERVQLGPNSKAGDLATAAGNKVSLAVAFKEVEQPWTTNKKVKAPTATLGKTLDGKPAKVVIYNVFVGRGIAHGIDNVLAPPAAAPAAKPAAAAAPAAKPAGRRLLQSNDPADQLARINAIGFTPRTFGDANQVNGYYSTNPANTFAAANSVNALIAGADQQTRWDRYLWYQGSNNNGFQQPTVRPNSCFNCGFWQPNA